MHKDPPNRPLLVTDGLGGGGDVILSQPDLQGHQAAAVRQAARGGGEGLGVVAWPWEATTDSTRRRSELDLIPSLNLLLQLHCCYTAGCEGEGGVKNGLFLVVSSLVSYLNILIKRIKLSIISDHTVNKYFSVFMYVSLRYQNHRTDMRNIARLRQKCSGRVLEKNVNCLNNPNSLNAWEFE